MGLHCLRALCERWCDSHGVTASVTSGVTAGDRQAVHTGGRGALVGGSVLCAHSTAWLRSNPGQKVSEVHISISAFLEAEGMKEGLPCCKGRQHFHGNTACMEHPPGRGPGKRGSGTAMGCWGWPRGVDWLLGMVPR